MIEQWLPIVEGLRKELQSSFLKEFELDLRMLRFWTREINYKMFPLEIFFEDPANIRLMIAMTDIIVSSQNMAPLPFATSAVIGTHQFLDWGLAKRLEWRKIHLEKCLEK
jgi:hypothetical protein